MLALVSELLFPAAIRFAPWLDWAVVVAVLGTAYYVNLSPRLAAGMAAFCVLCLALVGFVRSASPWPLWQVALGLFAIAWVLQFVGHAKEGKRPSFFKDLQFLLIGPAWLMSFVFRRAGIRY